MRILIVEEALQSNSGHWPVYLGDIAAGMRALGDDVDLLAHRQAVPSLLSQLGAIPWLSRSCWSDTKAQGQLGGLIHSLRFARELRQWLRQQMDPYTWICSLTMRLPHLLGYTLLARSGQIPAGTRCLLLFVQGFGVYQGPGIPVSFPATPTTRLAHWCFRRLAPAVHSRRVVLAAETRAMQAELEAFSQLPVRLFPHPVSMPEGLSVPSPCKTSPSPPATITCPGFARYEKGNDLLQAACRQLFAAEPQGYLQVISQWPVPFALPDGSEAVPDLALLADGRYQLINHSLNREAYSALLGRSDLIVLPYRRSSYHNRVSRVAIEAALHGIPLVFMSGTWIEEVAELTGAGVAIADETSEAVYVALCQAHEQLPVLKRAARESIGLVAERYSARRFRQLLLEC